MRDAWRALAPIHRRMWNWIVMRRATDDSLVALAGSGSDRAFATLAARYRRRLSRHCSRALRRGYSDDVVQRSLLSAWAALERGAQPREVEPWLCSIADEVAAHSLAARRPPLRPYVQGAAA